jgi:outer membrane protein assembly factor BamE (lipoprotein component of BamABCDE complex)
MKKVMTLSVVVLAAVLIQGCSGMTVTRKTMSSTGREIDRAKVQQIAKGKTTSNEIITWFGAPTSTSTSGNFDFITYKYCETSVSMWVGSQRDDCDTLTVTIDHSTSKVADYNLEEGIKKRTTF